MQLSVFYIIISRHKFILIAVRKNKFVKIQRKTRETINKEMGVGKEEEKKLKKRGWKYCEKKKA